MYPIPCKGYSSSKFHYKAIRDDSSRIKSSPGYLQGGFGCNLQSRSGCVYFGFPHGSVQLNPVKFVYSGAPYHIGGVCQRSNLHSSLVDVFLQAGQFIETGGLLGVDGIGQGMIGVCIKLGHCPIEVVKIHICALAAVFFSISLGRILPEQPLSEWCL
jgi:hypothetical protein